VRRYDWARIALPWTTDAGFERWRLIRRSRRDPDARACYLVFAPGATALAQPAGAVGLRGTSRNASSVPTRNSASITARQGPGTAGTAT
jgi:hypothetical protein